MFEWVPPWIRDVAMLLAFLLGGTSPLWLWLQRREANRRLVVEEGGLDVTQFDSLTATYKDLLDRANKATADVTAELKASQQQRAEMAYTIEEFRDGLNDVRALFLEIVKQHDIRLTPEQQQRFDATRPKPRPHRPAAV